MKKRERGVVDQHCALQAAVDTRHVLDALVVLRVDAAGAVDAVGEEAAVGVDRVDDGLGVVFEARGEDDHLGEGAERPEELGEARPLHHEDSLRVQLAADADDVGLDVRRQPRGAARGEAADKRAVEVEQHGELTLQRGEGTQWER